MRSIRWLARRRSPRRSRSARRREPDDRPRHRRHRARSALSQPHAEQQRRLSRLRLSRRAQREVADDSGTRHRVESDRSDHVGVQAAQGCEVPRRQRFHRRGRRGVHRPRAEGANSPSPFRRTRSRSRRSTSSTVHDPLQDGTPYPLMPSDMTQVAIINKQFAGRRRTTSIRQGGRRHRGRTTRRSHEGRPHRARAQRRLLGGRRRGTR